MRNLLRARKGLGRGKSLPRHAHALPLSAVPRQERDCLSVQRRHLSGNPHEAALNRLISQIHENTARTGIESPYTLGYPINCKDLHVSSRIREACLPYYTLNNIGDPFYAMLSNWRSHSLQMEKSLVLDLMAPWGGNEHNTWGYISTGGTESNIKGIEAGLHRLNKTKGETLVIYSSDAHYSVAKIAGDLLGARARCIPATSNGELDYKAFAETVRAALLLGISKFVVVATLGTTVKGASDDLLRIRNVFTSQRVDRDQIHIHVDAALNGGFWHLSASTPRYTIGHDFDSLAISGHKWYGGGFIAGLCALHRSPDREVKSSGMIPYVKFKDKAISGSRDGMVVPLWKARLIQFDWESEWKHCQEMVKYLQHQLDGRGIESFVNPHSVIVVFPEPSEKVQVKYQLATERGLCHVICMPHVTEEHLDALCEDLDKEISSGKMSKELPSYEMLA